MHVQDLLSRAARFLAANYIPAQPPGIASKRLYWRQVHAFNPGGAIGKGYQTIRVEARGTGRSRLTVRTRTGYCPGETLR